MIWYNIDCVVKGGRKKVVKKQVKREEIIEAAKNLIMQKGYRKTSVEDITSAVGIAKGSFYTYFKSKDFLMETLLTEKDELHKIKLEEVMKGAENLYESVKRYVTYYLVMPTHDLEFILVMIKMMRSIDSIGEDVIKRIELGKKNRKDEFVKILEKHIDEVDIKGKKDLEKYGLLVFGMINTFYINSFLPAENRFEEVQLEEIKEKIRSVDFQYETEFMTKTILKMIKK